MPLSSVSRDGVIASFGNIGGTVALNDADITKSTINVTITATNKGGAASLPEFTTVTVQPLPDTVAVTAAQYRLNKQRLDITATSTVVSPNVILTLQPYLTNTGTTFTPAAATFTNTGAT